MSIISLLSFTNNFNIDVASCELRVATCCYLFTIQTLSIWNGYHFIHKTYLYPRLLDRGFWIVDFELNHTHTAYRINWTTLQKLFESESSLSANYIIVMYRAMTIYKNLDPVFNMSCQLPVALTCYCVRYLHTAYNQHNHHFSFCISFVILFDDMEHFRDFRNNSKPIHASAMNEWQTLL